nr:hypothetical protein [uncultured bacterium]
MPACGFWTSVRIFWRHDDVSRVGEQMFPCFPEGVVVQGIGCKTQKWFQFQVGHQS